MSREEQIIGERIKKLEELKKAGINPYPNNFEKKNSIEKCLKFKIGTRIKTAGRILNKRDIGKIAFCDLFDGNKVQIVLQQDETPKKVFDMIENSSFEIYERKKYEPRDCFVRIGFSA